jgi:hypothetical protein
MIINLGQLNLNNVNCDVYRARERESVCKIACNFERVIHIDTSFCSGNFKIISVIAEF